MENNIENISVDNNNMTFVETSKKLSTLPEASTATTNYNKNRKRSKVDPILISWIKLPRAIYYFFTTYDLDK